jgi:cystathionine beta-lyase
MKYNFNEILPRKNSHSVKWDMAGDPEILPMWIADMDFRTFPEITEALGRIAQQGMFGYNTVPDTLYDSVISWWQKRHNCQIAREYILASTGVVAAISAAIASLTQTDDEVIVQTPAYNHFFNMLDVSGCRIVFNHLLYEDGKYEMDFDDLEDKASSGRAKVLLLCNPHNPVGRTWKRAELEEIARICSRNGITVISDEIHSDLVFNGQEHIPFISLEQSHHVRSVTCCSASKTFNLSGLHAAYVFASEPRIRKNIEKQLFARAAGYPGLTACEALSTAYKAGEEWLKELKDYIWENYLFLLNYLNTHLPEIKVCPLESTYLVWLDCSSTGYKSAELAQRLLKQEKLWLNGGDIYRSPHEGFLRMNIACPRTLLADGLSRFERSIKNL